jgi:hypothetical protein
MIGMEGWKDGDGLVARFREGGVCFDPRRRRYQCQETEYES